MYTKVQVWSEKPVVTAEAMYSCVFQLIVQHQGHATRWWFSDIASLRNVLYLRQARRNVLHKGTSIDLAFLDSIIRHLLVIMEFLCHNRFSRIV